jgi:hypothetical protein
MRAHIIWRSSALCVLLLSGAASGYAQESAASIEQLRVLVRSGDNIRVTDTSGHEMKGKLDRLSPSSISIVVAGHTRTLAESEILTIRRRKDDRLSDGARKGFIGGALLGLAVGLQVRNVGGGDALVAMATLFYGGIGAGIGTGIDAMVTHDRIIYNARMRRTPANVSVEPFVTPERKGVALSLRF